MKAAEFKVVQDARRVVQGQFSHYYQVMSSRPSTATAQNHSSVAAGADKKDDMPQKTLPK
ncbi:hypothetical protein [Polaromonas sp. AET17H-212]|uniref:hypothetical protein n=1 Tax=Polaromonas sp. AET17H-212 TaxID=1977061 RepID=UPI0011444712|nr:hypothetical protein [Polaromonas sp. AET17H-212]